MEKHGGGPKSEKATFKFSQNNPCIKMETQKLVNLLDNADNESSKFETRKCYVISDQNNTDYGERNEDSTTIKFETKVIKSGLCDYSDASQWTHLYRYAIHSKSKFHVESS